MVRVSVTMRARRPVGDGSHHRVDERHGGDGERVGARRGSGRPSDSSGPRRALVQPVPAPVPPARATARRGAASGTAPAAAGGAGHATVRTDAACRRTRPGLGPPISKTRSSPSGRSSAAIRYATTSAIAIGCVRVATQRGHTMTGRRSTSAASISIRQAAGADDDRRAKLDHRDAARAQVFAGLGAALQVLGELRRPELVRPPR